MASCTCNRNTEESQDRKIHGSQAVVIQVFHPSTPEAEAEDLCEFKASLVYKVSSGTAARATQTLFQKTNRKEKKKKEKIHGAGWLGKEK